ncbi:hypothetical protein DVH05_006808 [Phytophthora capsici]|nr:hypothetical protein DVH05_006808 [Phytophthora capsici]
MIKMQRSTNPSDNDRKPVAIGKPLTCTERAALEPSWTITYCIATCSTHTYKNTLFLVKPVKMLISSWVLRQFSS